MLKYRLRELLPRLTEQARTCQDGEVKQRWYLLKAIATSKRTTKAACEFRGKSRDWFYTWAKRLVDTHDLMALKSKSRRPKHSPWQINREVEKKILEIKNKEPYLGPERIANALEELYQLCIHPSTVYAALKRNNAIKKEYRERRTKKHTRRYRRPIPGYLQMDIKYVPYLIGEVQYYQLSAVDHCTSWRLIRVYRRKNEQAVLQFLRELQLHCPFPIFEIQTDNDAVFTDKYSVGLGARPTGAHPLDEWCTAYGCRHKLIPIGEKELNGKVENTHKYDDEEFYSQRKCRSFETLQLAALDYNHRWNEKRKTKTLGWRTPTELLQEIHATILTLLLCCKPQPEPLPQPSAEPQKNPLATKSTNPLDRYFAWMAWDAAQYPLYTILTVSGMSLSYSPRLSFICR